MTLALVTLLVYLPCIHCPPLWDDNLLVFENRLVTDTRWFWKIWFSTVPLDYFPLTLTSFFLEWHAWGNNMVAFHLFNISLHIANALLLWRLLARMRIPGAYWGAMLFALHPINGTTVPWIAEQKNTLSMLFYLPAILFFWEWMEENNLTKYYISLACFVLALLAKTSVVMLPVMLILFYWWRNGRVQRRDFIALLPFFAAALGLGLLTMWFQHYRSIGEMVVRPEGYPERFATAGMAVWFYLEKILAPINLTLVYPRWRANPAAAASYIPLLLVIAVAAGFFLLRHRMRAVAFAFGLFLISMLPVLGVLTMAYHRFSFVADHLVYSSLPALTALLAAGIVTKIRSRKAAITAFILIACAYIPLTLQRAIAFSSPEKLWKQNMEKNPEAWVSYAQLGYEIAVKSSAMQDVNQRRRMLEQALHYFDESIRRNAENSEVLGNRGHAYSELADLSQNPKFFTNALQDYEAALHYFASNADVYYNRANTYLLMSEKNPTREMYDKLLSDFDKAIAIKPVPDWIVRRGMVLGTLGRFDEARRDFQRAERAGVRPPEDFMIRFNNAEAKARMLNKREANTR
mgnify:CR=1 FL=1